MRERAGIDKNENDYKTGNEKDARGAYEKPVLDELQNGNTQGDRIRTWDTGQELDGTVNLQNLEMRVGVLGIFSNR